MKNKPTKQEIMDVIKNHIKNEGKYGKEKHIIQSIKIFIKRIQNKIILEIENNIVKNTKNKIIPNIAI